MLRARGLFSAMHGVVGHIETKKSQIIVRCRTIFSGTRLASLTIASTRVRRTRGRMPVRLGTTVCLTGHGVRAFRSTRHFRKGGISAVRNIAY